MRRAILPAVVGLVVGAGLTAAHLHARGPAWTPANAPEQAVAWIDATGTIPKNGYRTWSLFLVCDAAWLAPEKAADLNGLYQAFLRFGANIGQENLAVWFWKRRTPAASPELASNVDVDRSVGFCQQMKLPPSEGPYVVWLPDYPGEPLPAVTDEAKAPQAIALGGLHADRIAELLRRTGDQLALEGTISPPRQTSFFIRFLGAAQQAIRDFGCSINVKFTTGAVTAELRDCKG